jgi:hypothetical protein
MYLYGYKCGRRGAYPTSPAPSSVSSDNEEDDVPIVAS